MNHRVVRTDFAIYDAAKAELEASGDSEHIRGFYDRVQAMADRNGYQAALQAACPTLSIEESARRRAEFATEAAAAEKGGDGPDRGSGYGMNTED